MSEQKENTKKITDEYGHIRNVSIYDRHETYKERIEPLKHQLAMQCAAYGIPAFFTFAVANDEEHTEYERTVVHAAAKRILTEDSIATIMMKINGFDGEIPGYVQEAMATLQRYIATRQGSDEDYVPVSDMDDILLTDDETLLFDFTVGSREHTVISRKRADDDEGLDF